MYALTALAADDRVVTELMNKTRANSALQSLYIPKRVAEKSRNMKGVEEFVLSWIF